MNQIELSVRGEKNQMEESMWLVEMYELEKEMERWNETSIYRVPAHIKNMKYSSAYRPQLVSLGPFHHFDQNLRPMQGHKRRALLHLVKWANKPMDEFVAAVKEAADQLEAAYGQDLHEGWLWQGDDGRKRFVDMMVTDGCFLLEAMRMIQLKGLVPDYAPNDPIFGKHGYLYLKNVILADMFVMENQLPMLLLEKLAIPVLSDRFEDVGDMIKNMVVAFYGLPFDNSYLPDVHGLHPIDIARKILCGESGLYADEWRQRKDTMPSFLQPYIDIARKFFCGESERYADEWRERKDTMPSFLQPYIDIARKFFCGEREGYADERGERKDTMPSALELYEAGIDFKANRRCRSLLDIGFQRGVLSMPVLRVHNYVETVFLNLMAFEQLRPGAGNGVTEYLVFMDHIIDSAKDVALLRSKEVLDCALGSDKEVAVLFNTLSKGAMDPSMKLQGVRLRVNAYCRKPWNKWRASLVHTYFRNPWVFISLVAAAALLVATLLQTIFTIKPLR